MSFLDWGGLVWMTSLRMTHTLHLKCESNTHHKWSSMQTRWSSSHQNETLFAPASPPNTAPPPFLQSYAKVLTHFTLLSRRRAFCAPFSWLSHAPPSCNVCVQTIKLLVVCCYCGLLSPFFFTPQQDDGGEWLLRKEKSGSDTYARIAGQNPGS